MKMTRSGKLLLLLLFPIASVAQVHDGGNWFGFNSRFRIKKRIDLTVSHQVRTFSAFSKIDQVFVEPELRYKMKNGLRWAVAYRPSLKFSIESGTHFRHRYHIQVQYGMKFGDFNVGTRLRFQQRFVPIRASERLPASDQPMALRNKWSVDYTDLKKLTPFLQFEYFLGLSGQTPISFSTLRYKAGVEFDLPKKLDLSVFYMMEHEVDDVQPFFSHVIGITVSREFKIKRKD